MHLFYDATYHHIFKFSIKLLELGGELLQGKEQGDVSGVLQKQQNPPPPRVWIIAEFTSHVWLSLLTAGLLIPMMMAKKEFRFLNSRQLWANPQSDQTHGSRCCVTADGARVCVCVCETHCAAILMNFLRSCTLLLSWLHRQTSVTTHS